MTRLNMKRVETDGRGKYHFPTPLAHPRAARDTGSYLPSPSPDSQSGRFFRIWLGGRRELGLRTG